VQEVASGLFLCFPFSVIVMARKLFAAFLLSLQLLGIAAAGYTVVSAFHFPVASEF